MDTIGLKANLRKTTGKKVSNLRLRGILPAVIYGRGFETQNLEMNYGDFEKVYKRAGENTIIDLAVDDKSKKVLIQEAKRDPIYDKFLHVDFYQVRMDEKITANIPLVFEGDSPAIKDLSGILVKNLHEVEVSALPGNLPHDIRVDLSTIATFEDNICVKDLPVASGVEILDDSETVVASVVPPRSEAEMEALKEEVVAKVEEVKVETEEKKAAREQAKETEEAAK